MLQPNGTAHKYCCIPVMNKVLLGMRNMDNGGRFDNVLVTLPLYATVTAYIRRIICIPNGREICRNT